MNAARRLAQALREEGLMEMELAAREGFYCDFTSPLAAPITRLVRDLQAAGKPALAKRAIDGEFDGE
jgi:hypothetical protein